MSRIDRYIDEVMSQIYATEHKRLQFESDLRSHFSEAIAAGESEAEAMRKMGNPKDIADEFMAEVDLVFANFFERVLAFLVDISLCFSLTIPFFLLFLFWPNMYIDSYTIHGLTRALMETGLEVETIYMSVPRFILLFTFIFSIWGINILYFPLLEYRYGKTLGKYLLRLKVLNENGGEVGLGAAFVRRLSFYFEILGLDAIFQPFTKKKQRAFDMVAKTIVIRETDQKITPLAIVAILFMLFFPSYLGIVVLIVGASL